MEMGEPVRSDLLSDLPLGIIHDILARLSIRAAVRTSILSRQWRYTWTTLPHLLFDGGVFDSDGYWPGKNEVTNNVINSVFRLHKGPIHRFEVSFWFHFGSEVIEKWLNYLSRKSIRELIIKIGWWEGNDSQSLGSSIYSCTKLTKLVLWNFTFTNPPPSTFTGFLFLTSLHLQGVCLQGAEILLANSPLLESLTIIDLESSGPITINAPNLKYVKFHVDLIMELCLRAPLLATVCMDLETNDFPPQRQTLDSNYINFFRGCTNLVKLSGFGYFTQYLSIGIESCPRTLVLHHLKVIKLTGVNFSVEKVTSVFLRLIIDSPNLHKLKVTAIKEGVGSGAPYVALKDFGLAPNFTFKKLKLVSMFNICGFPFVGQFITFLLQRSPVLQSLNLGRISKESLAELLEIPRASPNAMILGYISKCLLD